MAEDIPLSLLTPASSPSAADTRRARELYRHVQPQNLLPEAPDHPTTSSTETAVSALRNALEPYVQLASLRCNAQRAFITLIDRESQYFLTEASRPINVGSTSAFEGKENLLWAGCEEGVNKSGTLCEMTIQLPPSTASHPLFEVKNLAHDDRFSQLPFVQGEPHFRFYAGTPLTTKRGINVGSICVMDTEVREGLNQEQTSVLGWLAELVITHLEINREAIEGRRSKLMSMGLNLFVDGRSKLNTPTDGDSRPSPVQLDSILRSQLSPKRTSRSVKTDNNLDGAAHAHDPAGFPRDSDITDANGRLQHGSTATKDRMTTSEEPSSEEETLEGSSQDEAVSENHKSTFGRAANILRECFKMEDNEGVIFVEAGIGLTYADVGPDAGTEGEVRGQSTSNNTADGDLMLPIHRIGTQTSYDSLTGAFTGLAKDSAHVLAFSSNHEPFLQGQSPKGSATLGDIDQNVLHELFKRYPHGKIWYLANGVVASSSEDDKKRKYPHSTTSPPRKPAQQRIWEAKILAKYFPEARQILFVPMWDAALSRWASACFVWKVSETRIFSTEIDLSFLSAFSKTIMAECSRLDTLVADKQKADFIGSISHELRSPLHGILAGAEFLSETATSVFQGSLIDTIEACGRTLLDTINHVLDFSKINSLDRNWRNTRQPRKRSLEGHIGPGAQISAKRLPSGAPPLLRLYAVTDIAAITEEVVEGLSIGQIYSQATDLTDMSASNRGYGPNKGMRLAPRARGGHDDPEETTRDAIEVLLDIAKEDWIFTAQSGAIRRVVMNLFGNAIKYTSSGTIKVELRLESLAGSNPKHEGRMMLLRISDTGKGIDAKFLSSRLFVPFAQENTLSPGTGLGMSIVRSIVTMMGGNIDVRSRLGKGTTVQVSLPLRRQSTGSASTPSPHQSTITTSSTRDDSIQLLRDEAASCVVSICGRSGNGHRPAMSREFTKVLVSYVRDWYGLEVCDWTDRGEANVLVIEEGDVSEVLSGDERAGSKESPALIVLCSNAARHREAESDTSQSRLKGIVVHLSKPCGPYKLARALRTCLEHIRFLKSTPLPRAEELVTLAGNRPAQEPGLPSVEDREAQIVIQASDTTLAEQVLRQTPATSDDRSTGVKANGGDFPFRSQGVGSTASPLSPEVQNLSRWNDPTPVESPLPKAEESGFRILLVDDNKINLQLLQTFMLKQKYRFIDSAEDGQVAVEAVKAAERPYDMIFMDISMPVMNGFEATRAIRRFEAEKQLKPAVIIALTGLANGRDEAEGLSAGCDIYMTKPASFKELAKLLKNCEGRTDVIDNP